MLCLIIGPLFTSLPSSVLSRAILNIIFLPPSSPIFRYSSSSIIIRALSTALLAAFLFWPYMCLKPVGGSSPLSLKPPSLRQLFRPPSLVSDYRCTSFPRRSTTHHTAPPPPHRIHPCIASTHPPLFTSPRLAPHTSSLPSPYTLPSSHPCTSITQYSISSCGPQKRPVCAVWWHTLCRPSPFRALSTPRNQIHPIGSQN